MTTTEPRPALKSLTATTNRPRPAEPARAPAGSGAPKVAAEGVPTAVLPDQRHATQQRVIGWLHVICPDDWRAPVSATSHCECGRHVTVRGRPAVIALVADHAEHRAQCPLHTAPERRQAA